MTSCSEVEEIGEVNGREEDFPQEIDKISDLGCFRSHTNAPKFGANI